MSITPTTSLRIDPELKEDALKILEPLGLNLTSAVAIFLRAVVREQGLPIKLKIQASAVDPGTNLEH